MTRFTGLETITLFPVVEDKLKLHLIGVDTAVFGVKSEFPVNVIVLGVPNFSIVRAPPVFRNFYL